MHRGAASTIEKACGQRPKKARFRRPARESTTNGLSRRQAETTKVQATMDGRRSIERQRIACGRERICERICDTVKDHAIPNSFYPSSPIPYMETP